MCYKNNSKEVTDIAGKGKHQHVCAPYLNKHTHTHTYKNNNTALKMSTIFHFIGFFFFVNLTAKIFMNFLNLKIFKILFVKTIYNLE